jgi:hypothetical protein
VGRPPTILVLLVVAAALTWLIREPAAGEAPAAGGATVEAGAYYALTDGEAKAGDRPLLGAGDRAGELSFGGTDPAWRAAVLASVARARPEAARLIGLVDGLAGVRVAGAGPRQLGYAMDTGGRYAVVLDLPRVLQAYGERGVDRVVLHELGHVVDGAIVGEELEAALDAQIPAGYPCPPGERTSACAPRAERFAETFAKWALGDLGINLNVGYAVAPPVVPLDRWGEPLAALGEEASQ